MTSAAQMQANRQNALKSTGPKSIQGKSVASQNSVKHGLLSSNLIIREEKLKELEQFRQAVYQALMPQGAIEELLVEKIINTAWRLRRLTLVENEILDDGSCSWTKKTLRQGFMGNDGHSMQNLSRYEASLERNFYRALHELQRLQAMRMGQIVMAPIAIEVSSEV